MGKSQPHPSRIHPPLPSLLPPPTLISLSLLSVSPTPSVCLTPASQFIHRLCRPNFPWWLFDDTSCDATTIVEVGLIGLAYPARESKKYPTASSYCTEYCTLDRRLLARRPPGPLATPRTILCLSSSPVRETTTTSRLVFPPSILRPESHRISPTSQPPSALRSLFTDSYHSCGSTYLFVFVKTFPPLFISRCRASSSPDTFRVRPLFISSALRASHAAPRHSSSGDAVPHRHELSLCQHHHASAFSILQRPPEIDLTRSCRADHRLHSGPR